MPVNRYESILIKSPPRPGTSRTVSLFLLSREIPPEDDTQMLLPFPQRFPRLNNDVLIFRGSCPKIRLRTPPPEIFSDLRLTFPFPLDALQNPIRLSVLPVYYPAAPPAKNRYFPLAKTEKFLSCRQFPETLQPGIPLSPIIYLLIFIYLYVYIIIYVRQSVKYFNQICIKFPPTAPFYNKYKKRHPPRA